MSIEQSSKRVPSALIAGFGSIGRRHFENLKSLGYRKFVFYRTFKGTLANEPVDGFPNEVTWDAALSHRPSIAVIADATANHSSSATLAATSGCDLYIEKPLSHSLDGCDRLTDIVRRGKLVAMVGCQFRFHPLLIRLRDQIAEGRLGRIIGARAEWGEYLPGWHPWEDHRKSYSARATLEAE